MTAIISATVLFPVPDLPTKRHESSPLPTYGFPIEWRYLADFTKLCIALFTFWIPARASSFARAASMAASSKTTSFCAFPMTTSSGRMVLRSFAVGFFILSVLLPRVESTSFCMRLETNRPFPKREEGTSEASSMMALILASAPEVRVKPCLRTICFPISTSSSVV